MWSHHMTLIGDSDDGGEDDELDQPLVNVKDKLRELTETHDLIGISYNGKCLNRWILKMSAITRAEW